MYELRCELTTLASIAATFAVFENPYNLARITPPWLGFRIVTRDLEMRQGAEIEYSFRWLGIPLQWKTEITAYDPPGYFVDEARRSPYSLWRHHHTFRETPRGTLVADRVEYELPFGALGRTAHAVVARQLIAIFNYRQKAILELLAVPATELEAPRIVYLAKGKNSS